MSGGNGSTKSTSGWRITLSGCPVPQNTEGKKTKQKTDTIKNIFIKSFLFTSVLGAQFFLTFTSEGFQFQSLANMPNRTTTTNKNKAWFVGLTESTDKQRKKC